MECNSENDVHVEGNFFHSLPLLLETKILEGVPLTISYNLYFLCISKVSSMLCHGSVGGLTVRMLLYIHIYFPCIFHQKSFVLSFPLLSLMKYRISATEY